MTFEIGLLMGLVLLALIFFSFEWVPTDVVALSLLLAMCLTGLVPAKEAFAGFGSDTVITILGLLIMTAALLKTGVMDVAGGLILRHTGDHPTRLLLVVMISAAVLSAFMSNTASTAFFVPIVIGIATKSNISPSKLLLPLAFCSILSSSVSLISTSTNIVVSGLMTQYKMAPMGMFELAPIGIPITIAGLIYVFFARRFIPDRAKGEDVLGQFGLRPYLTEVLILPGSSLIGQTLEDSRLGRDLDLTVVAITRNKKQTSLPPPNTMMEEGDVLMVEGKSDEILKVKDIAGIDIKADVTLSDPAIQTKDLGMVEAILLPKSSLIGRTLKGFRFRERFGLQVLGINRHGENIRRKMSEVALRMGDVLLIQGKRENIAALEEEKTISILGTVGHDRPNRKRAGLCVGIFVFALALATSKLMPFTVAVMLGSVLMFVTRCVTPEEAYREVEWKAIILIGSMLALGVAMDQTGAARFVASEIAEIAHGFSPFWVLTGFFFLTVFLTQPMSNQAAAVVILPVAIQTALQLDLNPRTFAMTVAVAASCSYLTPLEPSCLMVYGPGRYKFADFLKIGSGLTLVIYAIAIFLLPRVFPLDSKAGLGQIKVPPAAVAKP